MNLESVVRSIKNSDQKGAHAVSPPGGRRWLEGVKGED